MFHHDDFFNYIVDCILQHKIIQNDAIITLDNKNDSSIIKNVINNASSSKQINLFYKETQYDIDDIIKYEYLPHIYEHLNTK
jgi:hypothetical protein